LSSSESESECGSITERNLENIDRRVLYAMHVDILRLKFLRNF
jgi:hypothetical protein